MIETRKRRWFRFSLRTMFVLFTIVAMWLGWNVHVVTKRKAMCDALSQSRRGHYHVFLDDETRRKIKAMSNATGTDFFPVMVRAATMNEEVQKQFAPTTPYRVPTLRMWLGDTRKSIIVLYEDADVPRFRWWFPEAIIILAADPATQP